MRKFLLLSILFQLIIISSFAQLQLVEKNLTDLHVTVNSAYGIVRQADGKIITVGAVTEGQQYKTAIIRFDSTGALDNTFGKNGIDTFVTNSLLPGYAVTYFSAIALQGDKIILGGGAIFTTVGITEGNAVLARFTSNGQIDPAFGTNGIVVTNTISSTQISIDEIRSIFIDKNNKIIVAGDTYDYEKYRYLVAKYGPNGRLDTSFNKTGTKLIDIGTEDDEGLGVVVAPGNSDIYILGKTYINTKNYEVGIVCLKSNGQMDSTFGNNGIVRSDIGEGADIAYKIMITPGNKILCTGNSRNNSILALQYRKDGTPDPSFGIKGKVVITTPFPSCLAGSAALQPDGNIIIGGSAMQDSVDHFFAMRLLANGSFDAQFGNSGYFLHSVNQEDDAANAMCVLPGGGILQAGQVSLNAATLVGVLKLTPGGLLDKGFAKRGVRTIGIGSSSDVAFKMVRLPWDNSFLLCGTANGFWSLVKYGAGKSLEVDKAFGINGIATVPYMYYGDQFAEPNVAIDSALKKIYMCGLVGDQLYLLSFNSDGTRDTTFGYKGLVKYDGVSLYYGGLAVTRGHKIIFGGVRQLSTSGYEFAAMLNPNGTSFIGFGNNGEVRHLPISVTSIILSKYDNTIRFGGLKYSGGGIYNALGVLSLHPDGSLDSTYGDTGLATLKITGGSSEVYFKYTLAQDDYGRMLISGSVMSYDRGGYPFATGRLTKEGWADSTFATKGVAIIYPATRDQTNPANEGLSAGSISRNKCYIANVGMEQDSYYKTSKSVLSVYKNDGSLDTLNYSTGYWDKKVFGGIYEAAYAVMIDDVSTSGYTLYVAGTGSKGSSQEFALAKFQKQVSPSLQALSLDNKAINNTGIYPNPARSQVTVSYALTEKGAVNIALTDINGRMVKQYAFSSAGGQFTQTIQLPEGMAAGLYFVKTVNGGDVFVEKLLKQ